MAPPLPLYIRCWFIADALLALLPPLHWAASGAEPVFSTPRVIVYLFATSAFVSASVVAAYLADAEPDA